MKLNPENQKANRFPKATAELAWANDCARLSIGGDPDPRVKLRVSESARRACEIKDLIRALREFEDFAIVDIEHDLGRFSAPTDGKEELAWLVFYIAYENIERTREANPRVEEVVRVIKVITLEERSIPAFGC